MRDDASHKDLPRTAIMALANLTIIRNGGPERCVIHFKYTCAHCGSRQTFEQKNTCFVDGVCEACGKETKNIKAYGFLMAVVTLAVEQKRGEDGRYGTQHGGE